MEGGFYILLVVEFNKEKKNQKQIRMMKIEISFGAVFLIIDQQMIHYYILGNKTYTQHKTSLNVELDLPCSYKKIIIVLPE